MPEELILFETGYQMWFGKCELLSQPTWFYLVDYSTITLTSVSFQSLTSAKLLGVQVTSQVGVIAVNSWLIFSTTEPK